MARGKIKWFNDVKGFGFVTNDDGSGDAFIHYSVLAADLRKTLKEGDAVEFDIETAEKGPKAVNIKKAQ